VIAAYVHEAEVIETYCRCQSTTYLPGARCTLGDVPRLWSETLETHHREVRDAILETTMALVDKHGLRGVTMSQIAEETGIGRATLYKYFPDVEAILVARHEQHVADHLAQLVELRDQAGDVRAAIRGVLEGISQRISHQHRGNDLAALVHQDQHVARAEHQLSQFLRDLLADGVRTGDVRDDVPPGELASYCLHALAAAGRLPSKAAAHRLVTVTLAGLRGNP
jgi:AcrR family transcriptional regulator